MQSDPHVIEYTTYSVDPGVFKSIYNFFVSVSTGGFGPVFDLLHTVWTIYSFIAFGLSALFIYGIIYSYIRMNEIGGTQAQLIKDEERRWRELNDPEKGNRRWREVQEHLLSNNPNDWKLAIIEADVMLEKMLEEAGFAGVTVADRLRSASGRSFATIEDAWQAHRVRNQIAHGGADFVLTQRMAQTTIVQYQKVFQEFGMI